MRYADIIVNPEIVFTVMYFLNFTRIPVYGVMDSLISHTFIIHVSYIGCNMFSVYIMKCRWTQWGHGL